MLGSNILPEDEDHVDDAILPKHLQEVDDVSESCLWVVVIVCSKSLEIISGRAEDDPDEDEQRKMMKWSYFKSLDRDQNTADLIIATMTAARFHRES